MKLKAAKIQCCSLHFGFLQGLQIHQITGQVNSLGFAALTSNIIMLGVKGVEFADECLPYAGTLLVDGVFCRICNISDTLLDSRLHHPVANLFVDVKQLCVVVTQLLERDTFRVLQNSK